MGSNWSKLKKTLERGDEIKSLEIYNKSSEIKRKLNANAIVNEYTLDTYMHVCGKYGMVDFLKILLYENHGDPNKMNRHRQTPLHKICQGQVDSLQYECMKLLIQWQDPSQAASYLMSKGAAAGTANTDDSREEEPPPPPPQQQQQRHSHQGLQTDLNVNAKDDRENTPLHYAAMKNLPICVQTLVAHGAYLFVENLEHSTPCDLAEKFGHKDIALYLESKMIFSVSRIYIWLV